MQTDSTSSVWGKWEYVFNMYFRMNLTPLCTMRVQNSWLSAQQLNRRKCRDSDARCKAKWDGNQRKVNYGILSKLCTLSVY